MNCWKGRKEEQILFAFTPEDTLKTCWYCSAAGNRFGAYGRAPGDLGEEFACDEKSKDEADG